MVTPVIAIAAALTPALWVWFSRCHPAWSLSVHARFYTGAGYLSSLIATYFVLVDGGTSWVFGAAWAAAAVAMFWAGLVALRSVMHRQYSTAMSLETINADQVQSQGPLL